MTGKDFLMAWSWYYKNNWSDIYTAINAKTEFDENKYPLSRVYKDAGRYKYMTILDPEYPPKLLKSKQPPFVLFYKGDLSLLDEDREISGVISISAYGVGSKSGSKGMKKYESLATVLACKASKKGVVFLDLDENYSLGMDAFLKAKETDAKTVVYLDKQCIKDFLAYSCPSGMQPDLILSSVWEDPSGAIVSMLNHTFAKYNVMSTFCSNIILASLPSEQKTVSQLILTVLSEASQVTKTVIPYPVFDEDHCNNFFIGEGAEIFMNQKKEEK